MIETTDASLFLTDLSIECPDAPLPILRRALQRALKCAADTGIVTTWLTIPTQACVAEYPLEDYVCEGMSIHTIKNVEFCGACIRCVEECVPCQSGYQVDDLHHITLVGSFVPGRDSKDDLRVQVVLRINDDNCDIPKDALERFEPMLYEGTMYFLLRQKGQPWSDPRAARDSKREFEGLLAEAKCVVAGKFSNKTQSIKAARVL